MLVFQYTELFKKQFNISQKKMAFRLLSFLFVVLLGSFPLSASPVVIEQWSKIEIGGIPAGWVQESSYAAEDRVVTETVFHMEVRRGSAEILFELSTRFMETPDGRPLEIWSRQVLGAFPVETTWTFEEEGVRRVTRQADTPPREAVVAAPKGEWLTPAQLPGALEEKIASGEESFRLQVLDPTLGLQVSETEWILDERDLTLTIEGVEHKVSRWRQSVDLAPGVVSMVEINADGRPLRTSTQMMGIELTVTATSKEALFGALETQRESGLPELLVSTFVAPDRPLPNPRKLQRAVYRLRTEAPLQASDFPSTASQQAEQDGDAVLLTVSLAKAPEEEIDREKHLAATTWLDYEAEPVAELLRRALKDERTASGEAPSDAERARLLHRFVYDYLDEKNLNTVLATATEVARTGAGDCTEHGVLLAALLRGAGIPSRIATGLVYAEGFLGEREIFVYHMWSQAYLDGRWVDLDATLQHPFDAAHIMIGATALEDDLGALTEMAHLTSLMGGLTIEVVEPR